VAAKRQLSQLIDPGVPAGPSESLILADDSVNGALAALDLLIESEHGPDSSAYLVTSSRRVAEEAIAALPGYWDKIGEKRAGFSRSVLGGTHGGVVLTKDFATAVEFVNRYAPEHLEVLVNEPMEVMMQIRNAGEILLGEHSPIVLGNFVLGPNAVLPTNGAAKTAGPLSVFDYMKRVSIAYVTRTGYQTLAPQAKRLAEYEGFPAHALALSDIRETLLKGGGHD